MELRLSSLAGIRPVSTGKGCSSRGLRVSPSLGEGAAAGFCAAAVTAATGMISPISASSSLAESVNDADPAASSWRRRSLAASASFNSSSAKSGSKRSAPSALVPLAVSPSEERSRVRASSTACRAASVVMSFLDSDAISIPRIGRAFRWERFGLLDTVCRGSLLDHDGDPMTCLVNASFCTRNARRDPPLVHVKRHWRRHM